MKEICDVLTKRISDTAVGVWIKWWWHWCERSATDLLLHYRDTNSPFIGCFEIVGYERGIGDILGQVQTTSFPELHRDLTELIWFWPCLQLHIPGSKLRIFGSRC